LILIPGWTRMFKFASSLGETRRARRMFIRLSSRVTGRTRSGNAKSLYG
jgi:hypothetical protein